MARQGEEQWIDRLSDEDLVFVKRFLLASGSLKGLAETYGVSYPTIRLRLDRLIQKVKILDDERLTDEFERTARALFAEGRIDMPALKALLSAHRAETEEDNE